MCTHWMITSIYSVCIYFHHFVLFSTQNARSARMWTYRRPFVPWWSAWTMVSVVWKWLQMWVMEARVRRCDRNWQRWQMCWMCCLIRIEILDEIVWINLMMCFMSWHMFLKLFSSRHFGHLMARMNFPQGFNPLPTAQVGTTAVGSECSEYAASKWYFAVRVVRCEGHSNCTGYSNLRISDWDNEWIFPASEWEPCTCRG